MNQRIWSSDSRPPSRLVRMTSTAEWLLTRQVVGPEGVGEQLAQGQRAVGPSTSRSGPPNS